MKSEFTYGVISHQGDFSLHEEMMRKLGRRITRIYTSDDLAQINALIIPGGESTTLIKFFDKLQLWEPIINRINHGMPVFGTCAGIILLATEITNSCQKSFQILDISVERNGYGRQVESFEARVQSTIFNGVPFNGIFIRAPRITRIGHSVEILAKVNDEPVLVKSRNILGATFHPELSGDKRVHSFFIEMTEKMGTVISNKSAMLKQGVEYQQ